MNMLCAALAIATVVALRPPKHVVYRIWNSIPAQDIRTAWRRSRLAVLIAFQFGGLSVLAFLVILGFWESFTK